MTITAEESTRNVRYGEQDAAALLKGISDLYAAKGKKVVHVELSGRKPDQSTAALLLGPSGHLRAPAMRKGKAFMVGFDEEIYRKLLM